MKVSSPPSLGSLPVRLSLLLALVTIGGPIDAFAKPARIILLRHAEKPIDENDIHLSDRGRERARALVDFFAKHLDVSTNHPPAALFATRPTHGAPSVRTRETLEPLAAALTLPIQEPVRAADFAALAKRLLESPEYDGKTVVVCWVHDQLGGFARALGAQPKPKEWKHDAFDRMWIIRFKKDEARCNTVWHKLLPGDESDK